MFSLNGGTTFFTSSDPININHVSIDPFGDGLLCQSEIELASTHRGWFFNPTMASTQEVID